MSLWILSSEATILGDVINEYHIHDAKTLSHLVRVPVDLIVSSPPYFDMKDYGAEGQIGFGQTCEQYLDDMRTVFAECRKVIKNSGSMWLVVGTLKRERGLQLLPFQLVEAAQVSGWRLQEIVIWKKDRTLPYSARGEMRNIFEYVLFLVCDDHFKYHPERVTTYDFKPWWIRYPERYSVAGKAPTDVWEFPIPVQGSWGRHYVRHFCPLPEGLVLRVIDMCSDVGDVVLDPFAGSGAVLAAASRSGRDFVGLDLNAEFKTMFDRYLPTLAARQDDGARASEAKLIGGAIKKLRFLKLPSALMKTLRRTSPQLFSAINGVLVRPTERECSTRHKLWHVEYTFFLDDAPEDAEYEIRQLLEKPPLSKYGIEAQLAFRHGPLEDCFGCERWQYRWDATYLPPTSLTGDALPRIAATFGFDPDEESLLGRFR